MATNTTTQLETADIIVVVVYFLLVIAVGLYASCKAARSTVSGYFLAGRNMNFFVVACSLFVSNIGSEHFVGLAGSGAAGGIGVGAWEFNAILLLQLLGFVFVPVYIACKCYTMPEYLNKRFGGQRIRVYFAVLSLILYIFTKCSVNLYTGAIFIQQSLGWNLYLSILLQIAVVFILTITGGLTAVIYTDTLQALLMVGGSLTLTIMGFVKIGGFQGLWHKYPYAMTNYTVANTTCHYTNRNWYVMLRGPNDPEMPWPGFLFGQTPGSIWYWCSDQVIVQRALAAKSLSHAQAASITAGFIKILPLFMMVLPGMMSRVYYPDEVGCVDPEICYQVCQSYAGCTNIAYPKLVLGVMHTGLRGLMMAVLLAALMSDLDSIFNSASTLFTIDIWKQIRKNAGVKEIMIVGRVFVVVMTAVAIAWVPVVKETQGGQVFIYIQEVTNYLAPPVACVYLIAILWPRCNEQGCFWGLMAGFVTGVTRLILIFIYPGPSRCGEDNTRPSFLLSMHYMYFAMLLFWITFVVTFIVSLFTEPPPYKRLYRTLFWTRYDNHDPEAVESGKIRVIWHNLFSYSVITMSGTQTYDNPVIAEDDTDIDIIIPGKRSSSTQWNVKDIGMKPPDDGSRIATIAGSTVDTMPGEGKYSGASASYELKEGVSNEKQSCRDFMYNWICGISRHGASNEAANELAKKRETIISNLGQSNVAKKVLYFMLTLILACGIILYCFWSLWKYNPEGDVWTRLEQGLWNITDHRYTL